MRVIVPAVATITDFGVHALWSHPGMDLHLVMHERSRPAVARVRLADYRRREQVLLVFPRAFG